MIRSIEVKRNCKYVNDGYFGFDDYVKRWEPMHDFMERVNNIADGINGEVKSISYPNTESAIITYDVKISKEDEDTFKESLKLLKMTQDNPELQKHLIDKGIINLSLVTSLSNN